MNSDIVRISAVVPAYNVEKYIDESIGSLLNQTQPFLEIIIVDDGSSDGTSDVLEKYQGHDRIKVFHTANQGPGPARNFGLSKSTGDYIYFFDSDDKLSQNLVERISALIKEMPSLEIIFFSGGVFFDSDEETSFRPNYARGFSEKFECGVDATKALINANAYFASSCLFVSKKSIWESNSLQYPAILHEDEFAILQISCLAGDVLVINDALFLRRVRGGSIMTSEKSMKHVEGYRSVVELTSRFISANSLLSRGLRKEMKARLNILCMAYINTCHLVRVRPDIFFTLQAYDTARILPSLTVLLYLMLPKKLFNFAGGIKRKLCENS